MKPPDPSQFQPPKKASSKRKQAVILCVLGGLLVIALATFFVLGNIYSPHNVIDQFLSAMDTADGDALKQVSNVEGGGLSLNQETLAPFFDLYETDPQLQAEIAQKLEQDLVDLEAGNTPESGLVSLSCTKIFMFQLYQVNLYPQAVTVTTNLPEGSVTIGTTTISMAERSAVTTDQPVGVAEFSKVLPGIYTVTGQYDSLSATTQLTVRNAPETATLTFDYGYVTLENNASFDVDFVVYDQTWNILAGGALEVPYIATDATIQAIAHLPNGQTVEDTFQLHHQTGFSKETYVPDFNLLSITVRNTSGYGYTVDCNGTLAEVAPLETITVTNLMETDRISLIPQNCDYIQPLMDISVADHDDVTIVAHLMDENALETAVTQMIADTYTLYNSRAFDQLVQLPNNDLVSDLVEWQGTEGVSGSHFDTNTLNFQTFDYELLEQPGYACVTYTYTIVNNMKNLQGVVDEFTLEYVQTFYMEYENQSWALCSRP